MVYEDLLFRFTKMSKETLGDNLIGIYLHGSAAMGCFHSQKSDDDILENPLYVTLNLCRVLAYLQEGLVLSKKAGGEWGVKILPGEFHGLINTALACYEGERKMKAEAKLLQDFAGQMLVQIEECRKKL